ncbi:MAG: hypothetical protein AAFR59_04635, partial [Bacteroidota bacterium]
MKNILLVSLLIISQLSTLQALDKVNSRLYTHAQNYSNGRLDFEELHDYLVKPAQSEAERVEIFYYWMAQNIMYDVKSYQ